MFSANSLYIRKPCAIFFYEKVVKWCNVIEALNLDNEQERRNMLESGFKFLERTDHDTVEGTLKIIEKHFGL